MTLCLGTLPESVAEFVQEQVDRLIACQSAGVLPDGESRRWLANIGISLREKMIRAGLVPPHWADIDDRAEVLGDINPIGEGCGWVYVIGDTFGRQKIGRTAESPHVRIRNIARAAGTQVHVLYVKVCDCAGETERGLHRTFAKYRKIGEWFQIPPDHPKLQALRQEYAEHLTAPAQP